MWANVTGSIHVKAFLNTYKCTLSLVGFKSTVVLLLYTYMHRQHTQHISTQLVLALKFHSLS